MTTLRNESVEAAPRAAEPKISCRNVWKLYGHEPARYLAEVGGSPSVQQAKERGFIPAVCDASIDVMPGEILVLMGLSGSGKSTLVRCLSRLIEPTAGDISFDGIDLLAASSKELIDIRRHKMGMVFQHFALFPHRTVLENIAFPLEVQGVDKQTRSAKATEILDLVGLEGRGGYYPRELSGGQQQRVGIGRSLAVEPDVWFLDEPFSALDPLIRREMQDEFLRLQSALRKTIVFITHDFDEAIRLADRIAILYEGQIVQIGSAEELVMNPATDYVAAFTKDVQRDRILSVSGLMSVDPATTARARTDVSVKGTDKIAAVASVVLSGSEPVRVVDGGGAVVGALAPDAVVEALFGGQDPVGAQR